MAHTKANNAEKANGNGAALGFEARLKDRHVQPLWLADDAGSTGRDGRHVQRLWPADDAGSTGRDGDF